MHSSEGEDVARRGVVEISGRVVTGRGEGKKFTEMRWVRDQLSEKLNIRPHAGTLNLKVDEPEALLALHRTMRGNGVQINPPSSESGFCMGFASPLIVNRKFKGCSILPDVESYYEGILEIICEHNLRQELELSEGGRVSVRVGTRPLRPERIDALILDMDGTILDTFGSFYNSIAKVLVARGEPDPGEKRLQGFLNSGFPLERILTELLGESRRGEFGRLREEIQGQYREERDTIKPIAGAEEAVKLLRRVRGIDRERRPKVAIATGSTAPIQTIERNLQRFGLLDYFDSITSSAEVTRRKPAPDLILASIRKLGVEPASCLVVGDTVMDVAAGREAGCLTAAVTTGAGLEEQLLSTRPDFLEGDLFSLTERLVLSGLI